MPPVPRIDKMPPEVRAELDQRLRRDGYGDLTATAKWLTEKGHPIGKSAVHVYANRIRTADRRAKMLAALDPATAERVTRDLLRDEMGRLPAGLGDHIAAFLRKVWRPSKRKPR